MPKVSPIQSNFNGGEISPLLYGRVDAPRYKDSLAICENYIPLIQGPVTRRSGGYFVKNTKDDGEVRLVPFEVSTTQKFMIEFGHHYMRFYQNNGMYVDPLATFQSITNITNANPAVVTVTGGSLPSNGDRVFINGVGGMTEVNGREFTVAGVAGLTFQLSGVNSTGYSAYTSGGTSSEPEELTAFTYAYWPISPPNYGITMYDIADIPTLQFAQSNETLYIVHPNYPPAKVTFGSGLTAGGAGFAVERVNLQNGPYNEQIFDSAGATATITTGVYGGLGGVQLPIHASTGIFSSTDGGRLFRMMIASVWYYGVIDTFSSATDVTIVTTGFAGSLPFAGAVVTGKTATAWQLGEYSFTDGWPSAINFHEDRLVLGLGIRFNGSNTGDYENFSPSNAAGTISADNAYSFSLNSQDLNQLKWITSDEQGLVMGTDGGEWLVGAASTSSALSALSVSAKKATNFGSQAVQPVQSGKCTVFVQKGGTKIRELNYYFDVNGFRASNLVELAEHITSSGIIYLAVQKLPQPIVWAIRSDGVLLSMTYERDLDALKVGWARHIAGGTDAEYESVAVLASADGLSQDVWLVVKRTVGGSTVRHIEYFQQLFTSDTELEDAFFVDAGLTYDSTPTTTISGLNHLIGETVAILADGGPLAEQEVDTHGRITLDVEASKVHVGCPYNSDLQKLRVDAGAADGTAMAKTRRTHRVGIQLLNTLGLKMGDSFETLDEITLDINNSAFYGVAQALFSGITTQLITMDYDFDNMICIRQSQPLPGTILGIYPQMVTQDRG